MESPTNITDGSHRRHSSVGISQRVGKKLWACATITNGITDDTHRRNSFVDISQRVGKKLPACATITDGITYDITVEFYRRNIPSVTCGGNFFLMRLSVCMSVGNSIGIFFITDRYGDGIRITDAHDSDGFVASEIPSIIILPTE
jgi:hypothetical protein